MNTETLPAARIEHWLLKTTKSIRSQCMRGSTDMESNSQLCRLCGRYTDLKERAIELGAWIPYCSKYGFAESHDGFDVAA